MQDHARFVDTRFESWREKCVQDLKSIFVESYNTKLRVKTRT